MKVCRVSLAYSKGMNWMNCICFTLISGLTDDEFLLADIKDTQRHLDTCKQHVIKSSEELSILIRSEATIMLLRVSVVMMCLRVSGYVVIDILCC